VNFKKFEYIKLFSFRSVPVFSHWSLTVLSVVSLVLGIIEFSLFLVVICLWGVFLLHEFGHLSVAHHYGSKVFSICLYPMHGSCEYEEAETEFENCMISWGGFIAQMIVFLPCIIIHVIGSSHFSWFINIPLCIFGYLSLIIGFMNILPVKGFDGERCWRAILIHFKFKSKKGKSGKNKLRVVK